jgi:hypothetical protein
MRIVCMSKGMSKKFGVRLSIEKYGIVLRLDEK